MQMNAEWKIDVDRLAVAMNKKENKVTLLRLVVKNEVTVAPLIEVR